MSERRPLTEAEKKKVLDREGMRCFVNGHPIEDEDDLEFDHIKSIAAGGTTTPDNLAPVCKRHNRQKGKMSLSEYRDYLQLGSFFGDSLQKYLDDVIVAKGQQLGQKLPYEISTDEDNVTLYLDGSNQTLSLYTCPVTGWHYFYALIPVRHLKNDKDLQPRALRQKSMWGLYRHFLRNTQLAPSICRFDNDGQLLLFDGQHKAAAQIWAGRKVVECKVYIRPVAQRLKETNLEAHQLYRQMSFYPAELMKKYADIFGEDWDEYAALEGQKSEAGFMEFLINEQQRTTTQARREIEQAIHWRILQDSNNKLREFVSETTRTRQQPLTYSRLQKTVFRYLLSPVPSGAELGSDEDMRSIEEANLVRLMSIIAEEGLIERWNPERNDAEHQRTERIFSAGSIRAWVRILRSVLNAHLRLYLIGEEEVNRVLYREVTDEDFEWIRRYIRRIFSHSVWDMPDTADQDISKRLTKDDDTTAMSLLQEHGLVVNRVLESVTQV
jgi:hypothetical protein